MATPARERVREVDRRILAVLHRRSHRLHRITVGLLFVWFGLLKPFGHETATSVLATRCTSATPTR